MMFSKRFIARVKKFKNKSKCTDMKVSLIVLKMAWTWPQPRAIFGTSFTYISFHCEAKKRLNFLIATEEGSKSNHGTGQKCFKHPSNFSKFVCIKWKCFVQNITCESTLRRAVWVHCNSYFLITSLRLEFRMCDLKGGLFSRRFIKIGSSMTSFIYTAKTIVMNGSHIP